MKIRSDENEKGSENFSVASGAQKKGFPNFLPAAAFFIVEALKTAKKPLKFPKNVNFLKKGTSKFFRLRRPFFEKLVGRFYKFGRTKEGGKIHTLPTPL